MVYRLNCLEPTCKKFYIGQCDRILGLRLQENCPKSTPKTPNKKDPYIHSEVLKFRFISNKQPIWKLSFKMIISKFQKALFKFLFLFVDKPYEYIYDNIFKI